MTTTGDILCVHIDNKPSAYARVEGFEPDRKPGWWQIHLLLLTIPLQRVVWILKEEYFNGTPFTMQGTPMLLEPLPQPAIENSAPEEPETSKQPAKSEQTGVISLAARRARKSDTSDGGEVS